MYNNVLERNIVNNDVRGVNSFRGSSFNSNVGNGVENNKTIVKRGEIYWANLGETKGSIQGKKRPFLITSNWRCNENSSVISGVPLTSQLHKKKLPTHVIISKNCGLECDSIALAEQTMPLNKFDLISYVGKCSEEEMIEVEKAIQIQNGIEVKENNQPNQKQGRYFSASEKFQNEVFDIYKAKKMSKTIKELEKFTSQLEDMNVPVNETLKDSLELLMIELKEYCDKFNKDYKLFYKPIINKMVMSKGVAMGAL